jgi:MFS family permease
MPLDANARAFGDEVRRRRRRSSRYEDCSETRRYTRHSMPANSLDGSGFVRNPGIGIADVPTTGEKSRRLSCAADLAFTLPGVTGSLMAADPSASDPEGADSGGSLEDDGYQFPWWWFVILTLPGFLHSLVSNALWGIIWPNLLSQMSGDKYKFLALAAGSQICTVVGYAHPIIGSMSDRLPDKYAKYIGRRRPFIIIGSFIMSLGVWMTYDALYRIVDRPAHCVGHDPRWEQLHTYGRCVAAGGSWQAYPVSHSHLIWAYIELAASLVVGNGGSAIFSPPFTAIVADTIPLNQRGLCVVIQSWTSTVTGLGSGAIAYMVSEQLACDLSPPPQNFPTESEQWDGACFTAKTIWWCDIWILILQMPLYCICCNGKACDGCSWAGIWKPEKFIKRQEEVAVIDPDEDDTRTRCQRWKDEFLAFTSAFRDPCYRWLWIQGFVGQ